MSDFDIFFVPSRRLITRVAAPKNLRFGQREEVAFVAAVERAGDVARELQMLLLVFPHWHVARLVDENVRRHQNRVSIKTEAGHISMLSGLLLELCHPIEPAERGQATEQPSQLGVSGDHALVEDRTMFRVDTGGDISSSHLTGRSTQLGGILRLGERVQVDDAEYALEVVLQHNPIANGSEIIAEMQIAGRLDAGKNTVH